MCNLSDPRFYPSLYLFSTVLLPLTSGFASNSPLISLALLSLPIPTDVAYFIVDLHRAATDLRRFMVTCKSETPSRITDNVSIFDFSLTQAQMDKLNGLEAGFKVTPSTLKDPKDRKRYYLDMP